MHIVTAFLLIGITIASLSQPVVAFGAGDIPKFAYLSNRAFRHGDIESILSNVAKDGGVAATGGLMGIAASVLSSATGGTKFRKMDIKRVYFGNWLRDYSQAMDIAGLRKLTPQTLVTIVSILAFMTFGFATAEFEVTSDRLGVYLPVEHIDNPKGYAEIEGDARKFHPKLRPPVDPEELEIDPRNGMKKYIATEGKSWDTSSAHVRRTLQLCIEYGRRARGEENDDLWEAFRLLGTALHTLEDLLAHSNWCELAMRKLGHEDIFCHVGDEVLINTPHGQAPPLVTGTFGGADFMHSVLGEGIDHLSEASVTDLTIKMEDAKNQGDGPISTLKSLFSKFPSSGNPSNEMEQVEDIKKKAYHFNSDEFASEEVQQQLWKVLQWRDKVYRNIIKKIDMVPGLGDLLEAFTNALNTYVFTVLEPIMTPMLQTATSALQDGSKAVINSTNQFEVFNNPRASDPSHSVLSKDHFELILNEPAGKIAQVVVEFSVNLIVKAWYDENGYPADHVIHQILETFHHPYFATSGSEIQRLMMDCLERWTGGLGSEERQKTFRALTKDSVRTGNNKRLGSDNDTIGKHSDKQSPTRHQDNNKYKHLHNTGDEQHSGGGYGDIRYESDLPSQPANTGYDGHRQGHEPEGHHRIDVDGHPSGKQYGKGGRGERWDEDGYAGGKSSYEEPLRHSTQFEYGGGAEYGKTGEGSGGRERHEKLSNTEQGAFDNSGLGLSGLVTRQDRAPERHGQAYNDANQPYMSSYNEGGQPNSRENETYCGESQSYSATRRFHCREQDYGRESQLYEAEYQSHNREQDCLGGDQSYDRGQHSYHKEHQSYGEDDQSYGEENHSYDDGNHSYGEGNHSYGEGNHSYGEGNHSYGEGNHSYDEGNCMYDDGNRSYDAENQSEGRENQSYGEGNLSWGGEFFGRDAQSYRHSASSGYTGGSGATSYDATDSYTPSDGYETRRSRYGGANYGGEVSSHYGDGCQQNHGWTRADSETFGAEGLSLEDNGRRRGQPGYGRGLRRNVRHYFQE